MNDDQEKRLYILQLAQTMVPDGTYSDVQSYLQALQVAINFVENYIDGVK